jgi:histidinol-phosphatase (PHP family)
VLSDDSHGPQRVGNDYLALARYMAELQIHELWYLSDSSSPNFAGRSVQSVKISGDWRQHVYWINQGLQVSPVSAPP